MRLLLLLGRNQTVQIQGLASEREIQKHGYRMGQHFANQAMLKMPQVVDTNPMHSKAFRQMGPHGLHELAPTGAGLDELCRIQGGLHIFLAGRHHAHALLLGQWLLEGQFDKAFVGGGDPTKVRDQFFQVIDVVGPRCQQREVEDHPAA